MTVSVDRSATTTCSTRVFVTRVVCRVDGGLGVGLFIRVDRRGGGDAGVGVTARMELGAEGGAGDASFRRLGGFGKCVGGGGRDWEGATTGAGEGLGLMLAAVLPERR